MLKKLRESWGQKTIEAKIRLIASIVAMIILCVLWPKIGIAIVLLTAIIKVSKIMIINIFKGVE